MHHTASRRSEVLALLLAAMTIPISNSAASSDDDANQITSQDTSKRIEASKHLLHGGADAVTSLVKTINGKDRKTKVELIRTIKEIRSENKSLVMHDADAVELAKQARMEQDSAMRGYYLEGVRDLGGAAAIKELKRFASEDPDPSIRGDATHHVANLSPNETAFLKKQATDTDRSVRLAAFVELAQMGDKSGRAPAIQALKSTSSADERYAAIWILGESGNNADRDILKQIAQSNSEEPNSKFLATESLETIELLQLPPSNRLTFLMHALDDDAPTIRHWASNKLAKSTDLLTDAALWAYMAMPGHKGYQEAGHALNLRKK